MFYTEDAALSSTWQRARHPGAGATTSGLPSRRRRGDIRPMSATAHGCRQTGDGMINRVLDFLTGRATPALAGDADELSLAVAALLIETARMDDDFGAAERATIERLLAAKFGLAPPAVRALVAEAEAAVRDSTQFFPFTREICRRLEPEARVQIIELLWEVAYADGVLDPQE